MAWPDTLNCAANRVAAMGYSYVGWVQHGFHEQAGARLMWSAPACYSLTLRALKLPRVLSSVLRQLVGLVRQFKRPGGLIFGLLRLLVCLVRVFLG